METRSNRFLVLVVTGVLLGTLLVFTLWLLDARDDDGESYLIRFTGSVAGLKEGSPVTFSGVPAGRVTSIRFDKADPSAVLVTVNLEPGTPVVTGVKATIVRSAFAGTANISLVGARSNAPPIMAVNDGELPIIPANEGGLFGGGGDPVALVEKISRTVDSVSRNLNASHQQSSSEEFAALAQNSARWADKARAVSDGLTRARGRVVAVGETMQRLGNHASRLRGDLEVRGAGGPIGVNRALLSARDKAERFADRVETLRPAIQRTTAWQEDLVDAVRSARVKVSKVRETAVGIDQEGLKLGSPALPTYKPAKAEQ